MGGAANGFCLVSGLDGRVGVLTVDAKSGQFLQAGQSLNISAGQTLSSVSGATNATAAHSFHSNWLYLGLGGAAAAALAAGLGRGGGKESTMPPGPLREKAGGAKPENKNIAGSVAVFFG